MSRSSRRDFVASLASVPLAEGLSWADARLPRGLVRAPGDFLFAPGLVYLQTASMGPVPRPVMEKVMEWWKELELNPTFYGYGPHEKAMEDARANAAQFIGCAAEELVLTRSTTDGMNWVAQGLDLARGDRVVTSDQEHPGGMSGWKHVARRHGVGLDIVKILPSTHDAGRIVDDFKRAITPRTRVLMCSHVLSSTGLRMPVAELSALARSRDCLMVVDGAQAAGGIAVDVKALDCHAYVMPGHKWLLGPKGTGLLYLSADVGTRIQPIALEGSRLAYSDSSGVTSLPSVLGLSASIDYVRAAGIATVEAHNVALRNRAYAALQSVPRIQVVSAPPGPMTSPLVTFRIPDEVKSRDLLQRLLNRHRVMVKAVPEMWMNGNRLSTHLFNTEADVDAAVVALRTELA
ncbi:MAG: aminotransferase class V-fold PLP-dependent enzyme [Cytophagaceae bacterium]|nr:aminotransferase class V-fold PLP-dependent enzyme [Gemmatimonadaceae bacterium]